LLSTYRFGKWEDLLHQFQIIQRKSVAIAVGRRVAERQRRLPVQAR